MPTQWRIGPGEKGRELFEAGDHFKAHEAWEEGWVKLPEPWKSEVKAWIQVCGVLVHVKKGKWDPALRLAERAIEWLIDARAHRELMEFDPLTDEATLWDLEEKLLRLSAALKMRSPQDIPSRVSALQNIRPKFMKEGKWLT